MAPEVRDATSVAASQVAWTGDPQAPPCSLCYDMKGIGNVNRIFMFTSEEAPQPPDLDSPLDLLEPCSPRAVFRIERDYFPCFDDESYSQLPEKGPLHTFFYSTLVYPPAHPWPPVAPPAPEWRVPPAPPVPPLVLSSRRWILPLQAWGGNGAEASGPPGEVEPPTPGRWNSILWKKNILQ